MTEPDQSGGNAPAAEPNAATPPGGTTQPFGTFSATRGSGLARGKRSTTPHAASAAPAGTGDYKPTALEVITPEREYKNPFGDPVPDTPAVPPGDLPAEVPQSGTKEGAAPPPREAPAPREQPADLFPLAAEKDAPGAEVSSKPSLNILPQAETKRPALNWESEKSRDERPTFRPEPRRDQPRPEGRRDFRPERRDPRPAEAREPHREHEPLRVSPAPAAQKPRGFLAWLKALFAGKPAGGTGPEIHGENRGFQREGHHRRRRRGGRGRHFADRGGEREGQPYNPGGGEARFQGGEHRGDERGGNRGRRHRGGRGRGDHGGGPRSEGRKGGGAI